MSNYPDDDNGIVLRRIAESGVDMSVPRTVDFEHLFPDEGSARRFAAQVERLGFVVEVFPPDEESLDEGNTAWDASCSREMVPSHQAISSVEAQLASIAREHGGHEDGWGFVEE